MDPCQHVTQKFLASSTSENPKWQVIQLSSTCIGNVLESVNWSIPRNPHFLIMDSIQQFGNSLLFNTPPIPSDNSAALVCHINITPSTDSEAVELPIIGFNIAIYHNYDSERTLEIFFKKDVSTSSRQALQKSCRPSQCSRRARASFLCRIRLRRGRHQPQQPPPCNGKGGGAAQRRLATELCPHRLASRIFGSQGWQWNLAHLQVEEVLCWLCRTHQIVWGFFRLQRVPSLLVMALHPGQSFSKKKKSGDLAVLIAFLSSKYLPLCCGNSRSSCTCARFSDEKQPDSTAHWLDYVEVRLSKGM